MALTSTNVRVAPTGHIWIAPFGTTLPTNATAALNASFKELGYADENGVSITPSVNTAGVKAWQAAVDVKTILTDVGLDLKFTMIEITQDTTANFFFGGAWTNNFAQGQLTMSSAPALAERSMVIEWTDDASNANRLVLNRGVITDHDAVQLQRTDNYAFGVVFHVLDNNGTLANYYTTNPTLIPAT